MCEVQHQLVQLSYLFKKIPILDVSGDFLVVYVVRLADERIGCW